MATEVAVAALTLRHQVYFWPFAAADRQKFTIAYSKLVKLTALHFKIINVHMQLRFSKCTDALSRSPRHFAFIRERMTFVM